MMNPLKEAREAKGLTRPKFAMLLGLGYTQLAAAENGHHQKLPDHWRANFEKVGVDYDRLGAQYLTWRAAKVAELQKATADA